MWQSDAGPRCQCDTDGTMPGHCPGVDQCPYADAGDPEEAERLADEKDRWEADAYDRDRDDKIDFPERYDGSDWADDNL